MSRANLYKIQRPNQMPRPAEYNAETDHAPQYENETDTEYVRAVREHFNRTEEKTSRRKRGPVAS